MKNETNKARAVFVGLCLLVGGWAGVVVGALAMAAENVVAGDPRDASGPEQDPTDSLTRREKSQQRAANREKWLEWDDTQRRERRRAMRDWYDSDQTTPKPKQSILGGLIRRVRRLGKQLAQIAHKAKEGWVEGWGNCDQSRKGGKGLGEIIRDRRAGTIPPPVDETRTPERKPRPGPKPDPEPIPKPEPIPASEPTPEAPAPPRLPTPQIPIPEAPNPRRTPRPTTPAAPDVNLGDRLGDLARQIEEIRSNLNPGGTR